MRFFTVSDIHLDYPANLDWLMSLSDWDFQADCLLLAGDVSDKLDLLETCMKKLSQSFGDVFFVPGNHDLWVKRRGSVPHGCRDSLAKWTYLRQMADAYGVKTRPTQVNGVAITPLFAWYDFSFGPLQDFLRDRWMDFALCDWGEDFAHLSPLGELERAINRHFLSLNSLENAQALRHISFSHFLPRIDVMPDFIPPRHQLLYPILGTDLLNEQVLALKPAAHIYGHSHVNRHVTLDGIDYINNAFGNPGEERIAARQLLCLLDTENPQAGACPL